MTVIFYKASGSIPTGSRFYLNDTNTPGPFPSPPIGAEITVSFRAGWSGIPNSLRPYLQVIFGNPSFSPWPKFTPPRLLGDTQPAQYSFTSAWPTERTWLFIEEMDNYYGNTTSLYDITVTVTPDAFGEDVILGGTGWLRGAGRSGPPDGVNDFGMRLACYDPLGAPRGRTRARTIERYARDGDPGTLKGAAAGEDPGIELLADPVEVAVEVWDGAAWHEPDDARYITRTVEDQRPPGGIRTLDLTCVGIASLLSGALVWAAQGGELIDNKRVITGTPGGIILTLLGEAQARGCLPGITAGFTAGSDSSGASWGETVTLRAPLGRTLLDVLADLQVSWWTSGRTLHAGGRGLDLAGGLDPTHLRSLAVADQADTTDWSGLADTALLVGDLGRTWTASRATTPTPWGRQEVAVAARVTSDDSAAVVLDHTLTVGEDAAVQHVREWAWDPDRTRWMPDRDISINDWILIDTPSGRERVQVKDLMVRQNSEGIEVFVTTGTIHAELLERLARRLPELEDAPLPPPGGTGPTPATPAMPYINTDWHIYGGILLVTWLPVTVDVNGQPLTVTSYKLEARTLPGAWSTVYEGESPAQFNWPESAPEVEDQATYSNRSIRDRRSYPCRQLRARRPEK